MRMLRKKHLSLAFEFEKLLSAEGQGHEPENVATFGPGRFQQM